MLALVNTGSDKVCYREFFQFMFQEQACHVSTVMQQHAASTEFRILKILFRGLLHFASTVLSRKPSCLR